MYVLPFLTYDVRALHLPISHSDCLFPFRSSSPIFVFISSMCFWVILLLYGFNCLLLNSPFNLPSEPITSYVE